MKREVKEFRDPGSTVPEVVVMDVRDIYHGNYSVDRLVQGGYESVYASTDLQKCIKKAEEIFERMV